MYSFNPNMAAATTTTNGMVTPSPHHQQQHPYTYNNHPRTTPAAAASASFGAPSTPNRPYYYQQASNHRHLQEPEQFPYHPPPPDQYHYNNNNNNNNNNEDDNGKNDNNVSALWEQIRRQVEFYFSDANLSRDTYLQNLLNCRDHPGSVPVATIASFPKLRSIYASSAATNGTGRYCYVPPDYAPPANAATVALALQRGSSSVVRVSDDMHWIIPLRTYSYPRDGNNDSNKERLPLQEQHKQQPKIYSPDTYDSNENGDDASVGTSKATTPTVSPTSFDDFTASVVEEASASEQTETATTGNTNVNTNHQGGIKNSSPHPRSSYYSGGIDPNASWTMMQHQQYSYGAFQSFMPMPTGVVAGMPYVLHHPAPSAPSAATVAPYAYGAPYPYSYMPLQQQQQQQIFDSTYYDNSGHQHQQQRRYQQMNHHPPLHGQQHTYESTTQYDTNETPVDETPVPRQQHEYRQNGGGKNSYRCQHGQNDYTADMTSGTAPAGATTDDDGAAVSEQPMNYPKFVSTTSSISSTSNAGGDSPKGRSNDHETSYKKTYHQQQQDAVNDVGPDPDLSKTTSPRSNINNKRNGRMKAHHERQHQSSLGDPEMTRDNRRNGSGRNNHYRSKKTWHRSSAGGDDNGVHEQDNHMEQVRKQLQELPALSVGETPADSGPMHGVTQEEGMGQLPYHQQGLSDSHQQHHRTWNKTKPRNGQFEHQQNTNTTYNNNNHGRKGKQGRQHYRDNHRQHEERQSSRNRDKATSKQDMFSSDEHFPALATTKQPHPPGGAVALVKKEQGMLYAAALMNICGANDSTKDNDAKPAAGEAREDSDKKTNKEAD